MLWNKHEIAENYETALFVSSLFTEFLKKWNKNINVKRISEHD